MCLSVIVKPRQWRCPGSLVAKFECYLPVTPRLPKWSLPMRFLDQILYAFLIYLCILQVTPVSSPLISLPPYLVKHNTQYEYRPAITVFTMTFEPADTRKPNKIHLAPKDIDPAVDLTMYSFHDTPPFWTRGIFFTWHVSQNSKRWTSLLYLQTERYTSTRCLVDVTGGVIAEGPV